MTYEVISNIEVPKTVFQGRGRKRGILAQALDNLKVGDGFIFDDKRELKQMYPVVASQRFKTATGNKRFKLWRGTEEGTYGVKRLDDVVKTAKD